MSAEIEGLAKVLGTEKELDEQPQTGQQKTPYSAKDKFDICKVDYNWVDKTFDKKELKLAYECLVEDAGFPDLTKYTLKKLKEVNPAFKTTEDFNNYTPQEAKVANDDVLDFLRQQNQLDSQLKKEISDNAKRQERNKDIFGNPIPAAEQENGGDVESFSSKLELKRQAENERYKGNEFMKSRDYDQAVESYSKSISINPDEAATYSNRAMAYLRMKQYPQVIEDANKCLEIDPAYLKAFHRRGKAYLACNKYELAIKDFQYILEHEPENKDINKDLQTARSKLFDSQPRTMEITEDDEATEVTQESKPNLGGFRRVNIVEDSDSEEEEAAPAAATPGKPTQPERTPDKDTSASSSEPVIEEISTSDNKQSNWWQKKESNYAAFDMNKMPEAPVSPADKVDDLQRQIEELNAKKKELLEITSKGKDDVAKARADMEKAKKDYDEAQKQLDHQGKKLDDAIDNVDVEQITKEINAQQEEPKIQEVVEPEPAQPSSELEAQIQKDNAQKEKLRPKWEKIKVKVEAKKDEAAAKFKTGAYAEAINLYKKAAVQLETALEDFEIFKKEIAQIEASVFSNIAFCYGKDQQDKLQIEYASKVIDRALYLDDINVLVKAYLRRGLAYEHLEKYKLAANDLTRVRELQPYNKQAQTGLQRCLKYIQQDEGIDYKPQLDDTPLPELPKEEKPVQQETPQPVKEATAEPVKEPVKEEPNVEEEPAYEAPKVDFAALEKQLKAIKDKGNLQFKKKSHKEAIKHFSEGIKVFEDAGAPLTNDAVKTVIGQIYTNRSLAFHNLNQQASALSDANYVLTKIDSSNPKALFRRAHAYKTQQKYGEAVRDLQQLMKDTGDNQFKKELDECMKKFMAQQKKQKEEEANRPKISEVKDDGKKFKKVQIVEESSEDSDDADELQKMKEKARKKTAMLDKQTLEGASAIAQQQQKEKALHQIPKTAAGFEKDFLALKKDQDTLFTYIRNIPLKTIEGYFRKTEVTAELFSGIVSVVNAKGFADDETAQWSGSFLTSLAKSDNFEMTVMFADDGDRKAISEIVSKLSKVDAEQSKSIKKAYTEA